MARSRPSSSASTPTSRRRGWASRGRSAPGTRPVSSPSPGSRATVRIWNVSIRPARDARSAARSSGPSASPPNPRWRTRNICCLKSAPAKSPTSSRSIPPPPACPRALSDGSLWKPWVASPLCPSGWTRPGRRAKACPAGMKPLSPRIIRPAKLTCRLCHRIVGGWPMTNCWPTSWPWPSARPRAAPSPRRVSGPARWPRMPKRPCPSS